MKRKQYTLVQNEAQAQKYWKKKKKKNLSELQDNIKQFNICVTEVLEGKKGKIIRVFKGLGLGNI